MAHCDMFKSFPVISWDDKAKKASGRVKTDVRNDGALTFQTDASEIECDWSDAEEEEREAPAREETEEEKTEARAVRPGADERREKAEEGPGIVSSADARALAESSEPDRGEAWHRDNVRRFVEKANANILASAKGGGRFTKFCFDGCVAKGDIADWRVNEYMHDWFTPEILGLLRKAGYADASSPGYGTVVIRW